MRNTAGIQNTKMGDNMFGDEYHQKIAREALPLLIEKAKTRDTIRYGDLARKFGIPPNGVPLMGKAFNEETGNLADQDQHKDEKIARRSLFTGAIGAYKNPSSHRDVEITAEEATEVIIFASHLLRIVDCCAGRISNASN